MRIGIEAQRIFRNNKHGMDYVVLEEIKELQKSDNRNDKNVHIIEIGSNFYPLWEQFSLPRAVNQLNLDMLHCTSNTAPILCKIPMILTLHDIIFLEPRDKSNKSLYQNMGWLYRRFVVPRILKKCKRIITVSEFEYNNIISKLHIPEEKMVMIYNGYNEWFKPVEDIELIYQQYIEEPGYFFFLGNTDPKKNTERTLIAYSHYLEKSNVKRKLLMADLDRSFLDDIIEKNHIENIKDYMVIPGYIKNADLPYVYNNAFAFLYTSLRESFGIPLLEAMACGTPVITSNTSSMPEIGGSEALMVNPQNADEITEKMLLLEEDNIIYQKQKEIGIRRAQQFSWKYTAEQLLTVYEDVYKLRE